MRLFGFGKEKTVEETLAEGRAQFEGGDRKARFLTLHGLANKGEPEACYYIVRYWLKETGNGKMAKRYLRTAARANMRDAGTIMAKEYGIRDYLPPEEPKPAQPVTPEPPKPAPVPRPESTGSEPPKSASAPRPGGGLSLEERYEEGMEFFAAGKYDEAFPLLKQACPFMGPGTKNYPDGQAAMGQTYENGHDTEVKMSAVLIHYKHAAKNGNQDGMMGVVRLTSCGEKPSINECQTALEYAKQLNISDISVLEQKLADAQTEENRRPLFKAGMTAYKAKDYPKALALLEQAAEQGDDEAKETLWKDF